MDPDPKPMTDTSDRIKFNPFLHHIENTMSDEQAYDIIMSRSALDHFKAGRQSGKTGVNMLLWEKAERHMEHLNLVEKWDTRKWWAKVVKTTVIISVSFYFVIVLL